MRYEICLQDNTTNLNKPNRHIVGARCEALVCLWLVKGDSGGQRWVDLNKFKMAERVSVEGPARLRQFAKRFSKAFRV